MGKATGFLEYERKMNGDIPPEERVLNFEEFHTYLEEGQRKCQAARCMDCGVPMCQSAIRLKGMVTGCPLHNFIPEWNDARGPGNDSRRKVCRTGIVPPDRIYNKQRHPFRQNEDRNPSQDRQTLRTF